jgi:cell division protein FtsI/penicillin-binding protein 2
MSGPQPILRLRVLAVMLTVLFAGLAGWLGWLQLGQHERLLTLAKANLQRKAAQAPLRGAILDIRGNRLAVSLPARSVCADPSIMGTQQWAFARPLAPILGIEPAKLAEMMRPIVRTNAEKRLVTNMCVTLKRQVNEQTWMQITQALSQVKFPGIDETRLKRTKQEAYRAVREKSILAKEDQLRQYPNGALAAHVLGFVQSDETESPQGRFYETVGLEGIETTCDEILSGVRGWQRRGEAVTARAGLNVVLTLDAGVQNIVETELIKAFNEHRPRTISCIAVRPQTGEILAMANLPNYDPNLSKDPSHLINPLLSSPTEPGSTFKVLTIAAALDAGKISLETPIFCENGVFRVKGMVLHDHHPYGTLTVERIITKSSNIGAGKIGELLGAAGLYRYLTNFGLGSTTGIPLPGESRGNVKPLAKWHPASVNWIPMGHEVLVTPLQMVMAVSAIANEGRLMRPKLVDRLEDAQGNVVRSFPAESVSQVIAPQTARLMIRAMKTVVSPDGTANKARLEHFTVAGKTGTAEKFVNGNYKSGKYFASFIGFFPADRPELLISVVMDEPDTRKGHFGGEIAGPVFKAIGDRVANYLRLPPEDQTDPDSPPGRKPNPSAPGELAKGKSYAAANLKHD